MLTKEVESLRSEKSLISKNLEDTNCKYAALETERSILFAENTELKIKVTDYVNEISTLKKFLDVQKAESQNMQHQVAAAGTVTSSTDSEYIGSQMLFTKVAGHEEEILKLKRHKLSIENALVKQQNSVDLLSSKLTETENLIQMERF